MHEFGISREPECQNTIAQVCFPHPRAKAEDLSWTLQATPACHTREHTCSCFVSTCTSQAAMHIEGCSHWPAHSYYKALGSTNGLNNHPDYSGQFSMLTGWSQSLHTFEKTPPSSMHVSRSTNVPEKDLPGVGGMAGPVFAFDWQLFYAVKPMLSRRRRTQHSSSKLHLREQLEFS